MVERSGRDDGVVPAKGAFHVDTHESRGAVVLTVHGDVDMFTAPRVLDAVRELIPRQPATVIVDLSDVDFLASAGMTALVSAQRQLGARTRFLVVADGRGTSRPMTLTGVDETLTVCPTLDEALAASQQG